MKNLLFIQYPKCGTCRKAMKWLKDNKIDVESRDIVESNPTKEELSIWVDRSELPTTKFFNTSGNVYKENNLKNKVKVASKDELLTMLSSNGMLVKRPLLVSDDFVLVGFDEEKWSEKLK